MLTSGYDIAVAHSNSQKLCLPVRHQVSQNCSRVEERPRSPPLAGVLQAVHDSGELL